jgi:hypothetical protein
MISCNYCSCIAFYNILPNSHFLSSERKIIIFVYKTEKGVSETINFYTIVVVSSFLMKNVANKAVGLLERPHLYLLKQVNYGRYKI